MRALLQKWIELYAGNVSDTAGGLASIVTTYMSLSAVDASILNVILGVIGPIAFILMVIYFLMGFISEYSSGKEPPINVFVRCAIYLIIADLALSHSDTIISWIGDMSTYLMENISEALKDTVTTETAEAIATDGLSDYSVVLLACVWFGSLFGWIVSKIAMIAIGITTLSIKVELMLRLAFAPIGLAGLANEEFKHQSIGYLKKLIASAFYAMAMVCVVWIACGATSGAIIDTGSVKGIDIVAEIIGSALSATIVPFSCIGALAAAKTYINEAFQV